MSQIAQYLLTTIGALAGIGVCAGGLGYLIKSFKKGSREEKVEIMNNSEEIIQFWKNQADEYKKMLAVKDEDWNVRFQVMSQELGHIKGQLQAEKQQNERLEKIFQNRNPEQEKFMEAVMLSIKNQGDVNTEVVRVLKEIHALAVDEHNRETRVETTITKV